MIKSRVGLDDGHAGEGEVLPICFWYASYLFNTEILTRLFEGGLRRAPFFSCILNQRLLHIPAPDYRFPQALSIDTRCIGCPSSAQAAFPLPLYLKVSWSVEPPFLPRLRTVRIFFKLQACPPSVIPQQPQLSRPRSEQESGTALARETQIC